MQKLFKWFLMLNKRLYKKVTFIVLLAIVPLCVGALTYASQQQEGFLKVVLAQADNDDEISSQIVDELMKDNSLVRFISADSPEAALSAVKEGKADAAWILPENMQQRINDFAESKSQRSAVVKVVVRESNVLTRISQEKLTAAVFRHCSKAQFVQYSRKNIAQLDHLSDAELEKYFDDVAISEELFAVKSISGKATSSAEDNYMLAPIRGLLAVAMCICSAAATMFYMQDERRGTFSLVKDNNRIFVAFACILIATLNMAAVVYITLLATGLAGNALAELGGVLLFAVCSTLFCLFVGQILRSIRLYAASIPLMVVAMLAICPIFYGVPSVWYLLPPTYYVTLLADSSSMAYMTVYSLVLAALCMLLQRVKRKA